MKADTAEDPEPQDRKHGWDHNNAQQEFADGSPPGNAGNEHTDKRCPGEPPDHVGKRPGVEPAFDLRIHEGESPKAVHEGRTEIFSNRLDHAAHDEGCRAAEQNIDHQDDGDRHRGVRQKRHAFGEVDHQRRQIGQYQHREHHQRQTHAGILPAEQGVDPFLDLEDAHGDGAAEPDGDRHDRHQVEQPAGCLCDAVLTEDADQRSADQARAAKAETEIGYHQTCQRIDGPGMQTPVKIGEEQGGIGGIQMPFNRVQGQIMGERFGCPPIEDPHAHAGGKEHGQPGDRGEFRLVGIFAEHDPAIA